MTPSFERPPSGPLAKRLLRPLPTDTVPVDRGGVVRFGSYAEDHLARKAAARSDPSRWLTCVRGHVRMAVKVLGADTPLDGIALRDVERLVGHLLQCPNGRGGTLRAGTIRHYLNSLSHLFRRAERDGLVDRNPVAQLLERPTSVPRRTPWLEVPEVGHILLKARDWTPARPDLAIPFLFELAAVFAYTGVRKAEGLGLERGDLHLERGVLVIQPNRWRGLKTGESERCVPVPSELRAILRAYLVGPAAPRGQLIFPSPVGAVERPLTNLRRSLGRLPLPRRLRDQNVGTARLGTRMLRHTYCAARLQTLDHGAPISPYTVAQEMGHTDLKMVLRIYGHLGDNRCRTNEVRFLDPTAVAIVAPDRAKQQLDLWTST